MKWTICIKNAGYEASLESRKLYKQEDDPKAQSLGLIRVVDESIELQQCSASPSGAPD